ncbi:MAG: hypothetical protein CMM44_04870 [Rhodospirillaceae bacterium]|nr:hypothetical protein [Rhodospirillaceae bacterium]
MFDIGSWEFFLVLLLALFIIGPKDFPIAIRTFTRCIQHIRLLALDFKNAIENIELKNEVEEIKAHFSDDNELAELQRQFNESPDFFDKGNIRITQNTEEKSPQTGNSTVETTEPKSSASQEKNDNSDILEQRLRKPSSDVY